MQLNAEQVGAYTRRRRKGGPIGAKSPPRFHQMYRTCHARARLCPPKGTKDREVGHDGSVRKAGHWSQTLCDRRKVLRRLATLTA